MPNTTAQLAKHLRDLHTGKNWSWVNLRDTLDGVTWQQAVQQRHGLNSIATLVHHTHYYVRHVKKVLEGGALDAKDADSFALPPIQSQADWDQLLEAVFNEAEAFAVLIEQLPDSVLGETFVEEKYGTYYRNLAGIIEHIHYHLGQMTVLKKMLHA